MVSCFHVEDSFVEVRGGIRGFGSMSYLDPSGGRTGVGDQVLRAWLWLKVAHRPGGVMGPTQSSSVYLIVKCTTWTRNSPMKGIFN